MEQLPSIAEEARGWGGRIITVLGEDDAGDDGAEHLYWDPDGQLTSLAPAVLVTDEWGEIYVVAPAGDDHAWTSVDEILEWLRFIAIQCPECGVPEGGWKSCPPSPARRSHLGVRHGYRSSSGPHPA